MILQVLILISTIDHFINLSVTCGSSVVFSGFPPTNKTDRHDITEILLKVVLNTITPPPK
jgi:hypothetical protein